MATQTLTTRQLRVILDATYRQTTTLAEGSRSNPAKFDHDWALALANGTGAGQANFAWRAQYSIAAGGNQVVDLSALTDEHGNAIAPSKYKAILVRLNEETTDAAATLSVGNAAANAWTGICSSATALLTVRHGGWIAFACTDATGFAVAGGSKNVKILNNSGTAAAVVDVVVVGVK